MDKKRNAKEKGRVIQKMRKLQELKTLLIKLALQNTWQSLILLKNFAKFRIPKKGEFLKEISASVVNLKWTIKFCKTAGYQLMDYDFTIY